MVKRRHFLLSGIVATGFFFFLPGCIKDKVTRTHTILAPVFKPKSEVLAAINGNPSEAVQAAGKIYIKDKFIYLNEVNKGVHIIDNTDPSHPSQVAFLNIPGNLDIAAKGNTLYADMQTDLLAIDITDPKKVVVTGRLSNFFAMRMYSTGAYNTDTSLMLVDWIKKDTVISEDDVDPPSGCINCLFDGAVPQTAGFSNAGKSNGTAGSMASMVLMNDYLYAITEPHSIGVVDVSTPSSPRAAQSFFAGFDLETVYPFQDKLFLGSSTGMFMYDMSNPLSPVQLGTFSHGRACDPVITDGDYAYVTLHGGTLCGGNDNELNVVDVKNLMNPVLVKTYLLSKPTGLSKDGDLLFVCDGSSGVRVYDAAKPSELRQLAQIESEDPYDVIAGNYHAMVVAKDGLYQFDYRDVNNIRLLSFYSLKK